LGGLVGFPLAGAGYDALGGHRLFAVASGVELLAAALALWLGRVSAGASRR
jgi:PPP family 3-phenylpropionic acid transporter